MVTRTTSRLRHSTTRREPPRRCEREMGAVPGDPVVRDAMSELARPILRGSSSCSSSPKCVTTRSRQQALRLDLRGLSAPDRRLGHVVLVIDTALPRVPNARDGRRRASRAGTERVGVSENNGSNALHGVRREYGATERRRPTFGRGRLSACGRRRADMRCPVGYSESPTADDVASITSGPPPCATCTLRALDCSATGIVIVSTPWS